MSKTYKGYELLKAIADGEIKEGTKFKDLTDNNYADNSNIYRLENKNFIGRWGGTNILMLLKHDFELIEDEIEESNLQQKSFEEIGEAVGKMYLEFMKGLANAIKQDINKEDKQC